MGNRRYREQAQKDRAADRARVVRIQELRRSSAAEPVPSGRKYDRNRDRRMAIKNGMDD